MEITIKSDECPMCGNKITNSDRIRAHLIPKCLKPKNNVLVYLHRDCENIINGLYINQQTKSESKKVKKKMLNVLKDFKGRIIDMEKRVKEDG